jgi:hypothetical protein
MNIDKLIRGGNSKEEHRLNKIFGTIGILSLIAAVACTLAGAWIVPDINRWQAGLLQDNNYFPMLTAFVLFLPVMIPLVMLKIFLLHRIREKQKQ